MKRNQKTVEAAQIECKQKLNSDRKMEKLPAINAPYSVKLGVKGHIATN